ncbi:hypothetical protein OG21DRAFT_1489575 [Imleria badia]|nr:hypothetical protein OG21DRAFT_1489575 [Imleria badia]
MSSENSQSIVDFYKARKSRLNHLCLSEQQSNTYIEIKLVVAFDYEKKEGIHCLLPAMDPTILSSVPVAPGVEQGSLEKIYNIFVKEFLTAFCQRSFSWDIVELPTAMEQRLDTHDTRNHSLASTSGPFLFPDPMVVTSTPRTSSLQANLDEFSFADTLSFLFSVGRGDHKGMRSTCKNVNQIKPSLKAWLPGNG